MNSKETHEIINYLRSYQKKGIKSYDCYICGKDTVTSYKQKNSWKADYHYYKIGTRRICTSCTLAIIGEYNSFEKFNVEEEIETTEVYKLFFKVLKDKTFLEDLKEQRAIDEFEDDKENRFLLLNDGTHLIRLAGISYENRQNLLEKMTGKEKIELKREKENKHDENAIAVYATIKNKKQKIGYIPSVLTSKMAKIIDSGDKLHVKFNCFTKETYTNWDVTDDGNGHKEYEEYEVSFTGMVMQLKEKIYEHRLFRIHKLFE